ncbi:DUF2059 domain-containing protein [Sphingomonas sp.]|jgi:hypothetical protein|uniref:DUF2059 domain-containing protein n=1 Tax=Sphingomonas sp. TaxID=28214 RepID=UPI002EDA732D
MKKLIAAMALSLAGLAPAQARDTAPVASAAVKPIDQLVALLLPEDSLLALGARAFDAGLTEELAKSPRSVELHARHPGLKAHISAQVRPVLIKGMRAGLPELRREMRAIIAEGMTATEIADSVTFFSSPTGEKVRTQVYASVGDKPSQSEEQMKAAAMSAVMASLKAEDYPALIAFGASPAAAKMQSLNSKISAASRAWSKRIIDKHAPKLRVLAVKATASYLKGRS